MSEIHFKELNNITDVSRETFNVVEDFVSLLVKWNKKINLVGKSTIHDVWERHVLDSAQLIKYIPKETSIITDFGSGAGFPAIILSIIGGWEVHLVESDQRKCAFMREASSRLGLNLHIHNDRIENLKPWESDLITARALANLNNLINLLQPFIKKSKLTLFLKGQNVVEEIEEASKYWEIEYQTYPSLVKKDSVILKICEVNKK